MNGETVSEEKKKATFRKKKDEIWDEPGGGKDQPNAGYTQLDSKKYATEED